MHFHPDEIYSFFVGGVGFSALSYAAKTIPQPKNVWGLWIIGVIQFLLANKAEGQANLSAISVTKEI